VGTVLGSIFMGVRHGLKLPFMYWNQQTADYSTHHCKHNEHLKQYNSLSLSNATDNIYRCFHPLIRKIGKYGNNQDSFLNRAFLNRDSTVLST